MGTVVEQVPAPQISPQRRKGKSPERAYLCRPTTRRTNAEDLSRLSSEAPAEAAAYAALKPGLAEPHRHDAIATPPKSDFVDAITEKASDKQKG